MIWTKWRGLMYDARQWKFPREFRIEALEWPGDFFDAVKALTAPPAPRGPAGEEDPERRRARLGLLADIGTGLWRLRQRMVDESSGRPLDAMRKAYRHFESVWDALTQAGVEVHDHTGEAVPEGGVYALKTVAFQPTPGLSREKVIDTIKPSVYYRGELIQMGEVIVGTPEGVRASQGTNSTEEK
jgi:hypothetical protein